MATDNTNTFVCLIYPDAEYTGNPNGGVDWSSSEGVGGIDGITAASIGFQSDRYEYRIPDSGTQRIRGIDGVRKCFPFIFTAPA